MNIDKWFLDLMKNLGVSEAVAMPFLTDLRQRYNKPQLFYHNLSHIYALLNHFDLIKTQLNQPLAIELAIFYHDIVYDTTRSDNEANSAELMQTQLTGLIDNQILTTAKNLILMTQKHQLDDNLSDSQKHDASYFLDMDLAILGSQPSVYQTYAQAIRKEYSHFSDGAYKQGRAKVLTTFLQRPRLFFSDAFFEQFEATARQNLQSEIQQLNKST